MIALPFAGGAGLAAYILAGISLPLATAAIVLCGGVVWAIVISRMTSEQRQNLRHRVVAGLIAGFVGVICYDASRYGVVSVFNMSFRPFHVMELFGELWAGKRHSDTALYVVGFAYHISNGVFFGVAYTILVRNPRWWSGALWGMGLEFCMAWLYPSWLRIAQMREFLQVSVVGHLVYGAVLGMVAGSLLSRLSNEKAALGCPERLQSRSARRSGGDRGARPAHRVGP